MERLVLRTDNAIDVATRAARVLRAGGVILYPTDTLYGLGADAFSNEAVDKVYGIKNRDERKPMHTLVESIGMAGRYADVPAAARALVGRFGGNMAVIIPKKAELNSGIARAATFGFRVPDNDFCLALLKAFGGPITATSANTSGKTTGCNVSEILTQLGERAEGIGLVIDAGELPERKPSTVLDLSGVGPKILREGAIPASEIQAVLRG